jgi:hypothetical protein
MAITANCDLCESAGVKRPAIVDQATNLRGPNRPGPWAYMCEEHSARLGVGQATILANVGEAKASKLV